MNDDTVLRELKRLGRDKEGYDKYTKPAILARHTSRILERLIEVEQRLHDMESQFTRLRKELGYK